jgi:hypothetical protein
LTDNSADTKEADTKEPEQKTEPENSADVVPSDAEMNELDASFDSQVVVGKILNACTAIEQMFAMLNKHEINAVGFEDNLDAIKALVKTLL